MPLSTLYRLFVLGIARSNTYLVCALLLCASGCTPIAHDPDQGRIINPNSLAIIGPIIVEPKSIPLPPGEQVSPIKDGISKEGLGQNETAQIANPITTEKNPPISLQPTVYNSAAPIVSPEAKPKGKVKTTSKIIKAPTGAITGKVIIRGEGAQTISSGGVILTLVPTGNQEKMQTEASVLHAVNMSNKTYQPGFLTIKTNDRVSFLNKDKIKHNVFSSSGKNAFDLGTYSAGKRREVALRSQGLVKVYCNIHADMAIFIEVSDDGLSAITDDDGNFQFKQLEAGQYTLKIWHIRGEKTQVVNVESDQNLALSISLDTANYTREKHNNKFGKKYVNNIFDDEFY